MVFDGLCHDLWGHPWIQICVEAWNDHDACHLYCHDLFINFEKCMGLFLGLKPPIFSQLTKILACYNTFGLHRIEAQKY